MEGQGILKRRTSEHRCVGTFQSVGRVAWGDVLVDETEEEGKSQIVKGIALHLNMDFLLKVAGSHWRMLSSEVA